MERWTSLLVFSLLAPLAAPACPEAPPADDDTGGDDDDSVLDSPCDRTNTLGQFGIGMNRNGGAFSGLYLDGPYPLMLDAVAEDGACAFYRYVPRECVPPCVEPLVCAFDETCRPYPAYLSVGTVTIAGTDPELEVQPTEHNVYYTDQVYPDLFSAGDPLTVSASGGEHVEPFSLTVTGVPLLEPHEQTVLMVEGQPLEITWDTVDSPDGSTVRVHMDNDHHGVAAYAECEGPSSAGQLIVPESIVAKMIEAGASGIGTYVENAYLLRFRHTAVEHDPGCVEVSSSSEARLFVDTELR